MKGREIKKLLGRALAIILSASMLVGSNGIAVLAADEIVSDSEVVSEEQGESDSVETESSEAEEKSSESEYSEIEEDEVEVNETEETGDSSEDTDESVDEASDEFEEELDETEEETVSDNEAEGSEAEEETVSDNEAEDSEAEDSEAEEETVSDNEAEDSVTEESLNEDFTISGKTLVKYTGTAATPVIPEGIEVIGEEAFKNNASIVNIDIPNSVKVIEGWAFYGAENLKNVKISEDSSLVRIEKSAFWGTGIDRILIPKTVTTVEANAFSGCSKLKTVIIKTTQLGDDCGSWIFQNCAIERVEFPSGIKRIPNHLFESAGFSSAGVTIEIPSTVTSIGSFAFYNAKNLVKVIISEDTPLKSIEKSAFCGTGIDSILIPKTVTTIGETAFSGCSKLKTVIIKTTQLGDNCGSSIFQDCAIENVEFPSGIKRIPKRLFESAGFSSAGVTIEIPSTVTSIGSFAFYDAENLEKVVISEDTPLKSIEKSAFCGTGIDSILIPKTVTTIGETAFSGCSKLKTVIIKTTQLGDNCGSSIFQNCAIETVEFPSGIKRIPNKLFESAGFSSAGVTIEIPSTVTSIGSSAFYDAKNLDTIVIPESVNSIGSSAFTFLKDTKFKVVKNSYAAKYLANNGFKEQCVFVLGIKYNLKGGVNSPDNPASFETGENLYFAAPWREGYTFMGWFTDEACTKKITSTEGKNGALILYAKWKANTYTVNYDANFPYGSDIKTDVDIPEAVRSYGTAFTISSKKPAAYKYVFAGWNTMPDGSGKTYALGASAKNLTAVADGSVTLYGQWKNGQYNVAFDANKNSTYGSAVLTGSMQTVKVQFNNEENTIPANAFAITGYQFVSWNTRADGKGESILSTSIGTVLDSYVSDCGGKIILYAQWIPNPYKIDLYIDSSNHEEIEFNYGEVIRQKVDFYAGDRPGYKLDSLNTKADGTGTKVLKTSMNVAKPGNTKVLYVKWVPEKYKIVYKLGGVENNKNNKSTYTINTPDIKLLNPMSKPGYTFDGWYMGDEKITTIEKGSIGNIELEARWVPNNYTIVIHADTTSKANKKYLKGTIENYMVNVPYGSAVDMLELTRNYTEHCLESGATFTSESRYIIGYATTANGAVKYSYGNNVKNLSTVNGAKVHLYAVIGTNNVRQKISYELNGGVNATTNPVTYKCGVKTVISTPKRSGYVFAGWSAYWEEDDTECDMFDAAGNAIMPGADRDIVLKANWNPVKYDVKVFINNAAIKCFSDDGDSFTIKDIYYNNEEYYNPISYFIYDEDTYVFEGLFKQPTGGNPIEMVDDIVDFSNFAVANGATVKLYAHWSLRTYDITYVNVDPVSETAGEIVCLDGVKNTNPVTYKSNSKVDLVNPTRYGFVFEGWYTDPECTQKVTKITKAQRGNITLYGKWSVK